MPFGFVRISIRLRIHVPIPDQIIEPVGCASSHGSGIQRYVSFFLVSDSRAIAPELKTKEHVQRPVMWCYVDLSGCDVQH